jgi:hypothetical protein
MTVARAHTRHWSRKHPPSDLSQAHEQQDNAKMVRSAQQQIPRWLTSSSASTAAIGWSSSPLSLMRTPVDGTGAWYGVRGGSIDVGSLNSRPSGSPSCPCSHSPHTYTTPWRVRGVCVSEAAHKTCASGRGGASVVRAYDRGGASVDGRIDRLSYAYLKCSFALRSHTSRPCHAICTVLALNSLC